MNGSIKQRIGGNYSASPIAADGKLFLADMDGAIHVIEAGTEFRRPVTNRMNEPCLATPAIADEKLIVRTLHFVSAIGRRESDRVVK